MHKKSTKDKREEGTPIKQFSATKKNLLADRLFDKPNLRVLSQEKRPKIFSNSSQGTNLMPSITKAYRKKNSQY